jgi:DHA1 family bicyclomycin/chloramphenicol resistance-like MFS transporter
MLRPDTFALTAVLALLTAVGPLSVDMYLPSLPDIGRELGARPAQVQLTISFYLVGFALGQIVYGPISDRHGRKPVLLAALALFSTAGLACAFASSIEVPTLGGRRPCNSKASRSSSVKAVPLFSNGSFRSS